MALKVFYSSVCNELPTILMETRDELNNGGLQDRDAVENYDYSSSYYERGGEIETENRSLKWAQRSINKIYNRYEHSYYKYELGGQDENEDKQAEVERVINSILDPSYTFTNSSSSSTVYYEHEESRNPTLAAMAVLETICVERQKSSMEFLVNYVVERIATSYQNSHEGSAGERYAALAILSTISDGIKAMVRGNGDCKSRGAEEKNNSKVIEVITHQIEHVVIPEVFSEFNLDNGGYNRKEMRGGMNILRIKALEIVTRYSGLLVEYMANPQGLVLQLLEQITGNRREQMEVRILSALAVNELITKIDKANKKARNESAEGIETIVVHIIRYLMEMLEETVKLVNAGSTDANAEVIVSTNMNMNTNTNNVEVLLIELIQELVETYSGRIGREHILQLVQGLATKVDLLVNSLSLRLSKLAQQQHRNLGAAGGVIDGNDDDSDGDEDEEKKEQAVEMIKTVFGTIQILLEPLENHPEPILLGNSENNKSGSVDDNSKRPNGNNGESGVDCIQHIKGIVYPVISKIIELEIYECYQIAISVFDNLVFMTSSPLSAINGVVSGNYENKAQVEEFEVHLFRLVLNKVVGLFDPGNENISWETADQTMEILFESMVLVNTKLLNLHHRVKISGQSNVQGDQTLGYGENFVRDSNSGLGLDLDSITMRINMDLYYNEDGAVFQFMIRIIDLLFSQGGNGGEWRKVISNYFGSSGMDDDDSEGEDDNEMVDTICEIVQNIILLYSISTKLFNMDNVGIGGEKYVDRQVVEKYIRLILPLLFSSAAHPNTDTITNISGTKNRSADVKNQSMFLTVLSILTFNTYPYQVANVGLNVHQSMSFLLGLASHSGYQAVIERSIQKYAGRNRMRRIIDLKLTIVALLDYIQLCLSTVNSGGELKMVKMVKYVIDCFGRLPRAILQYNSLVRSSSQPGGGKTNNNRYGGDADEEIEDVVNLMEVHQEEGDQDDMDDYDEFGVEYDEEGGDGMDEEYSEVDENDIDVQEEQHEQQIVDSKHILFDFDVYSYFKSFYYKCYYPKISCLNREVLEQMESILNSDQRQLLLDLISN
ncbi:hypothetical protein AX774_g2049 [Zancudomyces culisetae]|uniref:Uncharacterized protein n=1 Tax=Zancudomyces culisetae TaxID=1213189 RepID=A0A1R1PTZ8_ZANCU|nr:hypothetical protein AX774_g2049 [Zancudomyces culisetae]|eukprot:OMH84424.1 hypothetical protein AX774_g2049 [Zancudomyces culisetae]